MKKLLSAVLLFILTLCLGAQESWTVEELPEMPEPVSNNAVVSAFCGDTLCVYSFTGIDSTKSPAGIHLKSWRYNTISQIWTEMPDVPDVQGKIAAAASTVNNRIYLVGGYYVNEDFSESSSDDVHIFNPETNSWEEDGANIPVPIDDHFQGVWRDSLIYVVTGWSDTQNVRDIQVYHPISNEWLAANDLPITESYPVFGTSGAIVNDTIFYLGGVNNGFNTMSRLRRGIINPEDPLDIEWSVVGESPYGDAYRFASAEFQGSVFFVGGSDDGYNFDGISYSTGLGVDAQPRVVTYYSNWGVWENEEISTAVMDLRSMAQITDNSWMICGGMAEEQTVSDKVYLLTLDPAIRVENHDQNNYQVNYLSGQNKLIYQNLPIGSQISVYNYLGQRLFESRIDNGSGHKVLDLQETFLIVFIRDIKGTIIHTQCLINY